MKLAFTKKSAAYTSVCKFCGKKVAEAPPLDLPIIGQPGKSALELQQILIRHIGKHHPEKMAEGAAILDGLLSFIAFNAFTHEDPSIPPRMENIRAQLFQIFRKNSINDAALLHIVSGFGLDPADAGRVNQAMQAVRDALTETGEHAPATRPAPSPLILTQ